MVQLDEEFGGQPPVGLAEAEDAAGGVNDALALGGCSGACTLEGESSQALRDAIEQLPEPPVGDTESTRPSFMPMRISWLPVSG